MPANAPKRLLSNTSFTRLWKKLLSWLDWRPVIFPVPRRFCHYLVLDIPAVPRRFLDRSIRLQLVQLTGLSHLGFVFQQQMGRVQIWYWDETHLSELGLQPEAGGLPCPEPLLRLPLENGFHLLQLNEGYEAVAIRAGQLHRTRWYPELPSGLQWLNFLRDAGSPVDHVRPNPVVPVSVRQSRALPKGCQVVTGWYKPFSWLDWSVFAGVALLGGVVLSMGLYQLKLELAIRKEQAVVDQISHDNAQTIILQNQIDRYASAVQQLERARPEVLQLGLMTVMADSGLFAPEQKTSLLEWDYRNRQLRLVFSIAAEGFVLTDFLAELEKLPIFEEIRLLPDTPARTVSVLGVLAPQTEPESWIRKKEHAEESVEGEGGDDTPVTQTPSQQDAASAGGGGQHSAQRAPLVEKKP